MKEKLQPSSNSDSCMQDSELKCVELTNAATECLETKAKDILDDKVVEEESSKPLSFVKESKEMLMIAFPVSIGSISRLVIQNIDTMFLGHFGTEALAGASLTAICMEIATLFVYSPTFSITSLSSQAIGAKNPKYAGYWLQLTIVLCTILTFPAYIFYFYISDMINIFSSNLNVVKYANIYAQWSALYLWTSAMIGLMRCFFQSLEIVKSFTIISILCIGLNIINNYIFIYGLFNFKGFGFIGSPIATSISFLMQLIMAYLWCVTYKKYHITHNVWPGWSLKSFECKKITNFTKVVIPNIISNVSENWSYQIVVLMCATLPASNVAALSCLFDIWGVLWAFYSGFGAALETKIAKQIGAGNICYAKYLSKIGLILIMMICLSIALLLICFSNYIALLYSNDDHVISIMKYCIPMVSATYMVGVIGWCASSILEAMSRTKIRGFICSTTAWFVFLPISLITTFFLNWNIKKMCPICCVFGSAFIVELLRTILLWSVVLKTDWKKVCYDAQKRNESALLQKEKEESNDINVENEQPLIESHDIAPEKIDDEKDNNNKTKYILLDETYAVSAV